MTDTQPTTLSAFKGCAFAGCERRHYAHGLCPGHYQQRMRGRELSPIRMRVAGSISTRLAAYTRRGDGCWMWGGSTDINGYGVVLDHLCRTRECINPAHLEPVTLAENTRRGLKTYAIRSTCKNGHDITDPANVKTRSDGSRACRTCARASFNAWYANTRKKVVQ